MLQIPLKIIDLQNDFTILVAKQWKIRISVPMSYISLLGEICDKLRIQGRMQLLGKSCVLVFNSEATEEL